ncbi:MAG: HAMP domain-containing histidine kinase [Roseburia sp.]|nr:HAMP domain-containing histidine kinase [Roseburia sp.]
MKAEKVKRRKAFQGNFFYRVLEFVLLVISILLLTACIAGEVYIRKAAKTTFEEAVLEQAMEDYRYINECYQRANGKEAERYSNSRNVSYRLEAVNGNSVLGDTYDGFDTRFRLVVEDVPIGYKTYNYYIYVDDTFPVQDAYRVLYEEYREMGRKVALLTTYRPVISAIGSVSILLAFFCMFLLLLSAGHVKGREEIVPGIMAPIHFDVLTVALAGIMAVGAKEVMDTLSYVSEWTALVIVMAAVAVAVVLGMLYLMEFVVRLKQGKWWKRTLIYVFLVFLRRQVGRGAAFIKWLGKSIPLVPATAILFAVLSLAELLAIRFFDSRWEFCVFWFGEKLVLFPVIIYCALLCKKLQKASEALAAGDLNYKLDTSRMFRDFKKHGDNLNHIGEGMTRAVEERMKSERLKTELITNVSHDLKTPLTSIINYADLLGNKGVEPEKVSEYAEVLLRQSKGLKKLLDDLIDASKATTGNLEVNLERCEIGVLLTQAAGEYEKRFAQRNLTLIARQPEEAIYIMADGRHLWRIFDNLLNNVCKYAQENSRVYLTLEERERQAVVIFRNMSRYALEISGEELQERFVRGDKSRNMEGNGLGLSIAKSLAELQQGSMEIVIDGDLFKVLLSFPVLRNE